MLVVCLVAGLHLPGQGDFLLMASLPDSCVGCGQASPCVSGPVPWDAPESPTEYETPASLHRQSMQPCDLEPFPEVWIAEL